MILLSLHTLPSRHGRKRRRVGRGHGSGRGTYAGRGMKGQRSRTGGKRRLTQRALKALLSKTPKRRGFQSRYGKFSVFNLSFLERRFSDGSRISPVELEQVGFRLERRGIKILGNALTKKLHVSAHAFSKGARSAILKVGGTVEILKK